MKNTEPAHPVYNGDGATVTNAGLTIRDCIAIAAMHATLQGEHPNYMGDGTEATKHATRWYAWADAMMEARAL